MNTQISERIKALENHLLQSEVRKSKEELNALLSDDFMEIGSLGQIYNKQDILDHLPKEQGIKWEMENFEARNISENAILVTYRVTKKSADSSTVSLRSSIWVKEDDNWRMVYHQGTPLNL